MKRSKVLDIMKGLGIILVVLGHCDNIVILHRTIYLFHLAIFFVVSGYLYSEKYSEKPWDYVGKLLKKYLKYYVIYNSILVLCRNFFIYLNILPDVYPSYGFKLTLSGLLNSFLFISVEPYSVAMWFIPVLLVGLLLFNFITNYSLRSKTTKEKEIRRFILVLILTIIGIYLNYRNVNIGLHYQTSLAIILFIYLGQCIKLYGKKYLVPNIKLSLLTIIIVIFVVYKIPGQVELADNDLWNPILYYTLAPLMCYVIYNVSLYIEKYLLKLSNLLSLIGKETIVIMCLHVVFFKLFDYIYINIVTNEYQKLDDLICSYKNLFVIYTIIGVLCPIIIKIVVKKILNKIVCRYKNSRIKCKNMN